MVAAAEAWLGTPYAWGGGNAYGPTLGVHDFGTADFFGDFNKVGFDCSGLMIYAFAGIGISLPHYTGYQYTAGGQVPSSQMKRGDMVFYGPNASQHVGLYLGNGEMIEAPQSGSVVKVSPLLDEGGEDIIFSEHFACIHCGISYPEITPRMFSFNNPHGACPTCDGIGAKLFFDPDLIVPDEELSLREGAIDPWEKRNGPFYQTVLEGLAALDPRVLLAMHGSTYVGDGRKAILQLADLLEEIYGAPG